MSKKHRCTRRTPPVNRNSHRKTRKKKNAIRKIVFEIAFKAIEVLLMITQIIKYLCEIIRK